MNIERLIRTAEVLETYAAERFPEIGFDMSWWGSGVSMAKPLCGTSACAVGHAALDLWFQAQGLRLTPGFDILLDKADFVALLKRYPHTKLMATFNGKYNMYAVKEFYDLQSGDVDYLFGADNPNDALLTAARIREFVAVRQTNFTPVAEPVRVRELEPAE